jgi:membrane carboxypeptidase/penicillin-binding protein PbpC
MEQLPPEDVPWFMWKTGTSSGRRDAWAVGHNGRYAIGVWVGRFRGTGHVAYVGAEAAEPLLSQLFALQRLRTNDIPPSSEPIRVDHELSISANMNQSLRITSPGNGDIFISLNGKVVVHPSTNRQDKLSWFLNGKLVDNKSVARLELTPGHYQLHCVGQAGQSSIVGFDVR